uniref:Telomere length regulation protein conserved domain-containing protein n=1 Tax=Ditylum brightwellii TaxID=49249 RepID=A0A7S4R3E9_9STRA
MMYNYSDDNEDESCEDDVSSSATNSNIDDSYVSSNDDDEEEDDSDDSDDDNSQWDEEDLIPYNLNDNEEDLIPYNLNDNEDDLRVTPTPRYLRECISYLRTSEDDKTAMERHEAALTSIPSIVQSNPIDLSDVAPMLAMEVLHKEDKFNMNDFMKKRRECMDILMVHEPILVFRRFVSELFGDNIALGTRMDILDVIGRASEELCGVNLLRKNREDNDLVRQLQDKNEPKVSGKRRLVNNNSSNNHLPIQANDADIYTTRALNLIDETQKTRRWGHGRNRSARAQQQRTVTNRFGPIAPLFFYPLLEGFMKSKDNVSIWGGANGSRLMSSFLVTLSTLAQSAGNHPGTNVLAADLFDLAWSFRDAEIAEVRVSVLVAFATSIAFLPLDFLLQKLYGADGDSFPGYLKKTAIGDSDRNCRELATAITKNVSTSLGGLGSDFGSLDMVERMS